MPIFTNPHSSYNGHSSAPSQPAQQCTTSLTPQDKEATIIETSLPAAATPHRRNKPLLDATCFSCQQPPAGAFEVRGKRGGTGIWVGSWSRLWLMSRCEGSGIQSRSWGVSDFAQGTANTSGTRDILFAFYTADGCMDNISSSWLD